MTGITVDLQGEEAILNVLTELIQSGQDLATPFADIGEYLLLAHDDRFQAQESPTGEAWASLSPDYAASKRKQESRGSDSILVLNFYLRSMLRYQASSTELVFGTDRVYGATHQYGDDTRGIPARPFLGISDKDEAEILAILMDWMSQPLG